MNNSIKVIDIPKEERPIEKLLINGPEILSNAELLAVILRTGTRGENVISLSTRILSEFDGLNGLLDIGISEITSIKGIKNIKASQILAIGELFRRFNSLNLIREGNSISSPRDIAKLLINEMMSLKQEILKLIMLDTKNNIIGIKDVFKGSLNTSIVHPREIFKEALKKSSSSIIICHNHPSGDPTPSKEDINITLRLKECSKIIGVDLLDHLIIGKGKFVSLKEKGII
ncbi:DNA repair protein RadC [Clostridium tertium]|jgi:DNA repair protein RadC|uniref:DNA repair protein RadC n=1 Tax=Clostridium tertium TaxID=1559 RepID=A0A9X4B1E3_9CLOT|nr:MULTISPECIES: DNA repair protein RadC [Clostridium]EEH99180.1 DNA repair protein RadC [Clostridium sp. 7_2_43FAA]MBU6136754.1 DNA repair protein RadC [Clostridium tertium]MDB1939550.1 DNA repair protein RadC [Clostridium tertium]MDB1947291.1 DNA repair protein RadC [Clostridium tertium]MDB1955609.1 DNA repair protein RadC [Clostridium tertium]